MLKHVIAAACVIGFVGSAAAVPLGASDPARGIDASQAPMQVAQRDRDGRSHHHRGSDRWRGERHWGRHGGPPAGWRRYERRPWDWRRRGCAMIGPVWFCP
jgi:hypothetical protein